MGYQIYRICVKFIPRYLLFLQFSPAFFLVAVTNIELIKTNISFLVLFFYNTYQHNSLFFAEKVLNIEKILFFFYSNNINTCYSKILALILFPSSIALRMFLVILVYFIGLIDKRLLFFTKYISKRGINRFILPRVLIFLFYQILALEKLGINLLHTKKRPQQHFCFCINSFLNNFFPSIQFLVLNIQLGLNKRLQVFLEVSNQNILLGAIIKFNLLKTTCKYFRYIARLKTFFS